MTELAIPEGFKPIKRLAAFMDMLGPIYVKTVGKSHVVGLRIAEKHMNMAGIAHGASILPVRVLGHCGGYDSDINDAIVILSRLFQGGREAAVRLSILHHAVVLEIQAEAEARVFLGGGTGRYGIA